MSTSAPKFKAIIADPPWSYRSFSDARNGAVKAHYDTMELKDLAKLPVGDMAEKDCALFMWATWPKLKEAIELIEAWDFTLVSGMPWVKVTPSSGAVRRGIGFLVQSASECLLYARRGTVRKKSKACPQIGLLTDEAPVVFYAPVTKHSKKPEEIQEFVERQFFGPHLELFATRSRAGWTTLGLSCGWRLTPTGPERVADFKSICEEHQEALLDCVKCATPEGGSPYNVPYKNHPAVISL